MAQAEECATQQARADGSDHANRRNGKQLEQPQFGRLGGLRLLHRRQGQRQQGKGKQDGDQRKGDKPKAVAHQDQPLANRQRDAADRHVGRKHLAALVALRHHIEPAFHHDVEPDDADAAGEAQPGPKPGVQPECVQDRQRRGDRRHGGKGPDVPDPADDGRARVGAVDKAGEVGRHHQPGHQPRKFGRTGLGPNGRKQQAGAHHQQADATQQRGQWQQQCVQSNPFEARRARAIPTSLPQPPAGQGSCCDPFWCKKRSSPIKRGSCPGARPIPAGGYSVR